MEKILRVSRLFDQAHGVSRDLVDLISRIQMCQAVPRSAECQLCPENCFHKLAQHGKSLRDAWHSAYGRVQELYLTDLDSSEESEQKYSTVD